MGRVQLYILLSSLSAGHIAKCHATKYSKIFTLDTPNNYVGLWEFYSTFVYYVADFSEFDRVNKL